MIYRGDCLEILKSIPDKSVDAVITDPPYGIDFQSSRVNGGRFEKIANDKTPFVQFIPEVARIVKDTGVVAIFTRWDVQQAFIDKMRENGMDPTGVLIWHKGEGGMGDLKRGFPLDYESIIYYAGKGFSFRDGRPPSSVIRIHKVNANKLVHPNEKPVELFRYLIDTLCPRGGVVLDCFMGSGASGVAAKMNGREYIGIELDEKYFALSKARIDAAREQFTFL